MLKRALLEQHLRLKHQLRVARSSRPKSRLLHLPPDNISNHPAKTIREKAFLMQLRLHLEGQIERSHP